MKRILILDAQSPEIAQRRGGNARYFEETLSHFDPNLEFVVKAPYSEEFDAHILFDVEGVVLTRSSVAWSVDDDRARPLQNACHAAFQSGLPIWGSCNGMQMAAFLLNCEIASSPNGLEMGLAQDITLTDEGLRHPMMQGRVSPFAVPCVHRDEVTKLPEGAKLLASNPHSPIQAMSYEINGVRFWGTQYHPEFAPSVVAGAMRDAEGIFSDPQSEADALERAEKDADAAKALGTTTENMQIGVRAIELKNWLDFCRDQ